jgi:hypothetical protein
MLLLAVLLALLLAPLLLLPGAAVRHGDNDLDTARAAFITAIMSA